MGVLGVALLGTAFALEVHAAQGKQAPAGESFVIDGPTHVVGVVDPGSDAREPVTCTVTSRGGPETIQIGTRHEAFEAVRVGRRVRPAEGQPTTVVCDRRVTVATGLTVLVYPLAGAAILYPAYVLVAVLGFGYARRRWRSRLPVGSPVPSGDDGARSARLRSTAEVALRAVGKAAGFAAIILGVVGLLVLREGSPAALFVLILAGLLGAAAPIVSRWSRAHR